MLYPIKHYLKKKQDECFSTIIKKIQEIKFISRKFDEK